MNKFIFLKCLFLSIFQQLKMTQENDMKKLFQIFYLKKNLFKINEKLLNQKICKNLNRTYEFLCIYIILRR